MVVLRTQHKFGLNASLTRTICDLKLQNSIITMLIKTNLNEISTAIFYRERNVKDGIIACFFH